MNLITAQGLISNTTENVIYHQKQDNRVRPFEMIWIRISAPRSHESLRIKGAVEPVLNKDSSASLMRHDPSDLGPL